MNGEHEDKALLEQGGVQQNFDVTQIRTLLAWRRDIRGHGNIPCQWFHRKTIIAFGFLSMVAVGMIAYHGFLPTQREFIATAVGSKKMGAVEESIGCAGDGESCIESKCCAWNGSQCYEKNEHWATCKPTCVPGPFLGDVDPGRWSCKELGNRTPGAIPHFHFDVSDWVKENCSKPGEDCTTTQCCSWDGMQCYVKDKGYASCRASCTVGPRLDDEDADPWSCETLGPRTPGVPVKSSGLPSEWVFSNCSRPNEDCRETKCCREPNVQCYEKTNGWAACKPYCFPGPDKFDVDDEPWSCKELGPKWTVTTTTTTTTRTVGFPSLFCFSVTRNFGEEPKILEFQRVHKTGIFGCDETIVFCTDPLTLGEGHEAVEAVRFNNAFVGRSKDNTAGNALLFMHVWDSVSRDGRWMKTDWTIKVDPDAVMMPDRLRNHLKPHNSEMAFVRNCNKVPSSADYPMMFGALEALSKSALRSYITNKARCDSELDWTPLGEDLYLQRCLLYLGVAGIIDLTIIGDNLCTGASCYNKGVAAFHPFKTKEAWKGCWGVASGLW